MPPFLGAALSILPQFLPTLAKLLSGRPELAARNEAIAVQVGELVTAATGAANIQQAVELVQADPAAAAKADAAVKANFADLLELVKVTAELDEKSLASARQFGDKMTEGPIWRAIGFGGVLLLLAFGVVYGGGWILREVLHSDVTDLQTRGMIIGALIGFVAQVLGYFFGSSASSRSKDAALERAAGRP